MLDDVSQPAEEPCAQLRRGPNPRRDVVQHALQQATQQTVVAALAELLEPYVGELFTVGGAANMAFLSAWSALPRRCVTVLEEKRGLLMAEGYARAARRIAAMIVTSGPGISNLATGLRLASLEQTAVFVIAGMPPREYGGRRPVQELDVTGFARPLTKRVEVLSDPHQVRPITQELIREALDPYRPGPVLLAVSADLWTVPCSRLEPIRLASRWTSACAVDCARELRSAKLPLFLLGRGVVTAGVAERVIELARLLPRAVFATSPRALGAFPATHPRYVGVMGFGGHVDALLDRVDLIVVLGSRLHEMTTSFDERFESRRILHIDHDPVVPGQTPLAAGFYGDLRVAVPELEQALKRRKDAA